MTLNVAANRRCAWRSARQARAVAGQIAQQGATGRPVFMTLPEAANAHSGVVSQLRDRGMDDADLAKLNKTVGDNIPINDRASAVPAEIVRRTVPLI
jgi:hypothetical protein